MVIAETEGDHFKKVVSSITIRGEDVWEIYFAGIDTDGDGHIVVVDAAFIAWIVG